MAILEAIDNLVLFVGHSIEGLAGWRYLIFPAYRKKVHARWAEMDRLVVAGEIFTFFVSFIFVTLLLGGFLWFLFS